MIMVSKKYTHAQIGCLLLLLSLLNPCNSRVQINGKVKPGFKTSPAMWANNNNGLFLVSENSSFAFGFTKLQGVKLFLLVVVHVSSSAIVWDANGAFPVKNSDVFAFDYSGNAYLKRGGSMIWSTDTAKKGASSMELMESGNLVLFGNDGTVIWQSFSYPTNTLLSNQEFSQGMKLRSAGGSLNLSYFLEIKSGDMILSADYNPPQPYWSMGRDRRKTIKKEGGGVVVSSVLSGNSWKFYDKNRVLIWEFIISQAADVKWPWIAVLGNDGSIRITALGSDYWDWEGRIPEDGCSRPTACDPYVICYPGNKCQCPLAVPGCRDLTLPSCSGTGSVEFRSGGDGLSYSSLAFVEPFLENTSLGVCKASCFENCSCVAIFFDWNSGKCFVFNEIGSMIGSATGSKSSNYTSYIKIASTNGAGMTKNRGKKLVIIVVICIVSVSVSILIVVGYCCIFKKKKILAEPCQDILEENEYILEGLSGMPIRFRYKDLETATNNFAVKLGEGGFGSVYKGSLPDGTQLAVKKLEGVRQGVKEFRAEVGTIGSIHHHNLVRLKGFCAEGGHFLLAYDYMSNGSLYKWLFEEQDHVLDWDTRVNIAIGTAKGLAYLHQECDATILHCDIKPENVLLDDEFNPKVSDFGLAKLMALNQSKVHTNARGTPGYMAPEWVTCNGISDKTDVYSYGKMLLELIGGRKNYVAGECPEKLHFPAYAFRKLQDGRLGDVVDSKIQVNENDERVGLALKVAFWCIQYSVHERPPMTTVVQMLQGLISVPDPPPISPRGSPLPFFIGPIPEGGALASGNTNAYLSAVRLSGPR